MSFDISRSSFRPRKNFLGVVMQQGRVQLDSDWNEWQSEFSRRIQAGTLDSMGQAVFPSATPNAFKITAGTNASGNTLYIGAGRYYVDGLLAENHGPESEAIWDDALAEMSGAPAFSTSTAQTDYTEQPYLPNAVLPANGGVYVAYLDVWQRDVTYLEDPGLIDKAVNIDTTGRLQTVWQVKLLTVDHGSSSTDCSTDVPAFDALSAPPAGRLSSGLVPNAASGPCCLAPNTGFTGQENQLYRVEIHSGGTFAAPPANGYSGALPAGTPTFKWSRDNASVQSSVSAIGTLTNSAGSVSQLTVGSLGRDQVLGFGVNDWIEITDDAYELNNQPGEIYQITGVVAATNMITLSGAVSSHFVLTGGLTNPKLHTRITRWDQSGQVYSTDSSGNLTPWYNLAGTGAMGVIPIPPKGTTLVLENGVTVSFDLSPEPTAANPTAFRDGDYWLFTARAADGSVEVITEAPPLGINHHYAKLGVVTLPSTILDCRVEWPPAATGSSCCCSVTVSPSQLTGNTTLQTIVNSYQNGAAPTTICLEPGTYPLAAPLRFNSANTNITIEACKAGTVRLEALAGSEAQFNDGLVVLDNSASVTLSGLTFAAPASAYSGSTFAGLASSALPSSVASLVENLLVSIGVRIVSGEDISIRNCEFLLADTEELRFSDSTAVFAAGVLLNGETYGLTIQGCEFRAGNFKLYARSRSGSLGLFSGVAMASSVAFTGTTPVNIQGIPINRNPVEFTQGGELRDEAAATPEAKVVNTGEAEATANAPVPAQGSNLTFDRPGLQNFGGTLRNIFNFGGNTPSALAAQGGTVLPASLDEAVITGNTFAALTLGALLLGETGAVEFSDNELECVGGFWVLAPSQTQMLLNDPQNLALVGATVALSLPLPQNDSSSTVTVPAASPSVYLYTGNASSGYLDSNGNTWLPDNSVASVTLAAGAGVTDWTYIPNPAPTISNTSDPTLYQSERAGPAFSYTFTGLNAGFYAVTLDFAEIFYTSYPDSGIRIFNVTINNLPVLTNFDIGAVAGPLTAYTQTFTGIPADNGSIVVQFTGTDQGSDHNAKISALSLIPVSSGAPYLGTGNESDSPLFFDQLAQVAWQGSTSAGLVARLRFDRNEMQALSAAAILLFDDDNVFNGNSGSLMLTGNRIDGVIGLRQFYGQAGDIAADARLAARQQDEKFNAGQTFGGISFENYFSNFSALVVVSAVSRAVVTSNMITNFDSSTDTYGECLILSATGAVPASVTIMSNLLTGYIRVPSRNINDTSLDFYAQSWNFLNTIVND